MIHHPRTRKRHWPLFFLLAITQLFAQAQAQPVYAYQDLSKTAYSRQRDSLKKAWVCPAAFTDKAAQKKYKELWDGRTNFMMNAISSQRYVMEKDIFGYVSGVLAQLVKGNPKLISSAPLLLVDRNAAVNAYAVGGNIIAVNLGLLSFAESREELALVLAHELSHNILNHPENSMREQAQWLTSEAYQKQLKEVLNSQYDRYTRLRKVFESYTISSSKHHRYHESDADSLAMVLLSNSRIGFDARFYLRLDSADMQYKLPLQQPVAGYFTPLGITPEAAWQSKRSKGLSGRAYNFKDTASINDSLKTHPDCAQRYAATQKFTTAALQLTPIPAALKEKASKIIIWNLFDNLSLTPALYRILQQKDGGTTDVWYDFMLCNILTGLYHADKTLHRFNAIGIVPKEQVSKSYYELQNTMEQIPKDTLEQYYKTIQTLPLWTKLPEDLKGLNALLATVIATEGAGTDQMKKAAQRYIDNYGSSMYCEFADHFTGK